MATWEKTESVETTKTATVDGTSLMCSLNLTATGDQFSLIQRVNDGSADSTESITVALADSSLTEQQKTDLKALMAILENDALVAGGYTEQ